uniref:Telomere length regulation protein TEL2 putative n=1 Tax=Albugo laibachii Nc14 TaxID=890382 RepID=F0WD14_9STRA|nr:telomere length regulation protein TEL2 putative [Albugo laibachii Nc14]|eukprot:CCA19086.1 telomere length regulation protein TEL2 putative [Albugo laibachii Nc14]
MMDTLNYWACDQSDPSQSGVSMSSRVDKQALEVYLVSQLEQLEVAAQCFDLDATVKCLSDLGSLLLHPDECSKKSRSLFIDHCYLEFTAKLIPLITGYWGSSLTQEIKQNYVDVFFTRVPSLQAFESLNALLTKRTDYTSGTHSNVDHNLDRKAAIDECIRLLHLIFMSNEKIHELVQQIFEMEAYLVHNHQGKKTPYMFDLATYFPKLCKVMLQVALEADEKDTTFEIDIFRFFCNKLKRTGRIGYLIKSWMQLLSEAKSTKHNTPNAFPSMKHIKLINNIPEACYEDLLSYLCTSSSHSFRDLSSEALSKLSSRWIFLSLFVSQTSENDHFRHIFTKKVVLKKPMDNIGTIKVVVDALNGIFYHSEFPGKSSKALRVIFGDFVHLWSQRDFSHGKDQFVLESVTCFIRYAMQYVLLDGRLSEKWILMLCKGVQVNLLQPLYTPERAPHLMTPMSQNYLDSSVQTIQEIGMQVGQTLSQFVSPVERLDFCLGGDDIVGRLNNTDLRSIRPVLHSPDPSDEMYRRHRIATKCSHLATDEIVLESDDESEHDEEISNSGSELSLSPYDMDDSEEDIEPPRPKYLKDLIIALQMENEREIEVAALTEAEVLIRKRPLDLDMHARTVAQLVLRLEDRYNITEFSDMKARALIALCTQSPVKVIPYCINQVLEKEQMLESRITILKCMKVAAYELSQTGAFGLNQPKDLLMENIEAGAVQKMRTRRWGFQRNPLASPKKNAFAEHALTFFYPMVYGYIHFRHQHTVAKTLSEMEHIFLSYLLHTLSCIVECSGNSAHTPSMAKVLLDFAWVERQHFQAGVRRQVLYCISRIFLVIPSYLVQQQLGEKLPIITQWLRRMQIEDPDAGCREAASLLTPSAELLSLSA